MASQRITIVKIGGKSANAVLNLLNEFMYNRKTLDLDDECNEWSGLQWSPSDRVRADHFAHELRTHGYSLPIVHFVEWWDPWSMGDIFHRWLTPRGVDGPLVVYGDRFEIYGYLLPDGGALARHLANAGPQQFVDYDHLVVRIRESVEAWGEMVSQSVVIILREVFGGLVTDDELLASMSQIPDWLSGC